MIVGGVTNGRPVITARVLIPRLGLQADVDFLVDTGSQTTLINPSGQRRLGVSALRHFAGRQASVGRGLGGRHSHYSEPCDLYFMADDDNYEHLRETIRFARPSLSNANLRSLLGVDLLRNFRFVFEPRAGLVTLDTL